MVVKTVAPSLSVDIHYILPFFQSSEDRSVLGAER